MRVASPYFHLLNGRLRIKIAEIKGSPARALEVESRFLKLDGIKYLKANPTTGNILVIYDHDQIGPIEIIETLKALGYLQQSVRRVSKEHAVVEALVKKTIKKLAYNLLETALYGLVSALI